METPLGVGRSRDLCPVTCLLQQQSIEVLRSLDTFRQRNKNCIWQKEKTVSHLCPSDYYMLSCFTTRTTLLQRQKIETKKTQLDYDLYYDIPEWRTCQIKSQIEVVNRMRY